VRQQAPILRRCVAAALLAASGALLPPAGRAAADDAVGTSADMAVEVELTDGAALVGDLVAIDGDEVRLMVEAAPRTVAVANVRRLGRREGGGSAADGAPVTIIAVDGSRLTGDRFLWQGDTATLERREGAVRLPIERVRTVVMRPAAADAGGAGPAWLEALPAEPAADVVAVARDDGFELVECAIVEVAAETVTVLLDGERIPVKAGKVLGLSWVRPAVSDRGGTLVAVPGGRLTARRVEWSPDALVLDGQMRLPASMLAAVDYAAGRTVAVASLPAERTTTEPFFAALAVDGMKPFFAPRPVRGPGDPAADPVAKSSLLVRPRTVTVWRVPADSRRFRATLRRAGEASGTVDVRVLLDDVPAFAARCGGSEGERAAAAEPVAADRGRPIDIDVSAARRLTIVVDFVAGDLGCPVRFDRAVFEK
jgi:hypothetical protein